ncbi:MAG: SCP2 sterol-binding domain-containing protein [Candidatus Heimdallarchaeota archaeon]|nr:SCP2 sterol-binding domain-containing protein [Candidatus Heimdallarchaeota archaeon]MCK4955961.1 SCP2 sterol-binding domain-containing protein [Candidatus Heimdallarchaeota archaeon]
MVNRTRSSLIGRQVTAIYTTFMFIGLGLLILTLILLLKIYEIDPVNPQSEFILFVFMIIFAVLGFGFLINGTIGVLRFLKKMKKKQLIFLEDSYSAEASSLGSREGLQIIRPHMPTKSEDSISRKRDAELKTKIETALKEEEEKAKPIKKIEVKPSVKAAASPGDFSYNDGLQSIIDRYNTEKVRKAFKGWFNTLMMTFPDISKSFLFMISGNEGIDLSEGVDEEAAVQVKMDSTIFVRMMTKQINPIKAYSSGNLEVKGEMKNMLKLRKLMF